MRRIIALMLIAAFTLSLAACGSTPDTEGMTVQEARQELEDAGVKPENINVVDVQGNPANVSDALNFVVCDHDPDGVSAETPTTLTVAPSAEQCPEPPAAEEESGSDSKKKKKSSGSKKRR